MLLLDPKGTSALKVFISKLEDTDILFCKLRPKMMLRKSNCGVCLMVLAGFYKPVLLAVMKTRNRNTGFLLPFCPQWLSLSLSGFVPVILR